MAFRNLYTCKGLVSGGAGVTSVECDLNDTVATHHGALNSTGKHFPPYNAGQKCKSWQVAGASSLNAHQKYTWI